MAYVAAVLGAVCLINLGIILALARRVRRHDDRLTRQARLRPLPGLTAGSKAPDFTVTTTGGETRSLADLQGDRGVVAFLMADSAASRARIPDLKDYAQAHASGLTHVVAVICGDQNREAAKLAAELQDCMSVVIEPLNGPMQRAYSATEFPLFYVIRPDGWITARGAYIEAFNGPHLRLTAL
jgi:hypothetical protein